jgi:hypothetical protein
MEKSSADCQTCHGHAYRIEVERGFTVNVDSAKALGIKGKKIRCIPCSEAEAAKVAAQADVS